MAIPITKKKTEQVTMYKIPHTKAMTTTHLQVFLR